VLQNTLDRMRNLIAARAIEYADHRDPPDSPRPSRPLVRFEPDPTPRLEPLVAGVAWAFNR
jgi:hypothetical protein